MTANYNKEWATGDIIEATDLNAITPFMFGIVYNEDENFDETTATVQEIVDGLSAHNIGFVVNLNASYPAYDCAIILSIGFDERTGNYNLKLYGSYSGSIQTITMVASSADSKFHTVSD